MTNESYVGGLSWVACYHDISMECIRMSEFLWVYRLNNPWIIHEILAMKILFTIYEIISFTKHFQRYDVMDVSWIFSLIAPMKTHSFMGYENFLVFHAYDHICTPIKIFMDFFIDSSHENSLVYGLWKFPGFPLHMIMYINKNFHGFFHNHFHCLYSPVVLYACILGQYHSYYTGNGGISTI